MSDPNPESSERSRIKGAHEVTLAYIREGSEVARGHNKHADQMLVWLIALSGGSVLLAFQVPDRFLPTSTWWLIVAIVPWAVTVVAGVWARDLMARLMLADDMSTHTWAWELAHLPFLKDYASVEFKTRLLQRASLPCGSTAVFGERSRLRARVYVRRARLFPAKNVRPALPAVNQNSKFEFPEVWLPKRYAFRNARRAVNSGRAPSVGRARHGRLSHPSSS